MDDFCPAEDDWINSNVFDSYYLVDDTHEPFVREPSEFMKDRQVTDSVERARFGNANWRRIPIVVTWAPGRLTSLTHPRSYDIRHYHTSFYLGGRHVHVDFMHLFTGGPQTRHDEFRIFVDGEPAGRGGGFTGFLGGRFGRLRHWPLAARIGNDLIYIYGYPWSITQKEIDMDDLASSLSIWALEIESGSR